jgi:hypothetical protein
MLADILNIRRGLLLLREEIYFLPDVFSLSAKHLWELRVSERLGTPSFMRVDEKRWCQASG